MSEKNGNVLRSVAWSELCPWLCIFRAFRIAIGVRVLLLGAAGALLTSILWGSICYVFDSGEATESKATDWLKPVSENSLAAVTDRLVPNTPWPIDKAGIGEVFPAEPGEAPQTDPITGPWMVLSKPLWRVFDLEASNGDLACLLLCGFCSLAIWAFFGAAISRVAAVQLASEERIGWGPSVRHACSKWVSYFAGPLFPLFGIALSAIPIWILCWLLRADFGIFIVGLIWPVCLGMGLIITLLLLGLLFGWPLMWATVSVEGTDSFDALSRSYAYVFQRPIHYLFYAFVAAVFGALGWFLVRNFAAGVVWLTYWAASWSGSTPRVTDIMNGTGGSLEGIGLTGAMIIHFWAGFVKLVAVGFIYSYFWTAVTAIYYLLRHDVDATEMDEVYLDADQSEQTFGMPPLRTDASGVPTVVEESAEKSSAGNDDKPAGEQGASQ
jgi:hypothetical protein